jgi:hypothetical protein
MKNVYFKHLITGKILRLIKKRSSNINSFIEVDEKKSPIIIKRPWSTRPEKQMSIIKGFDKLINIY